MEASRFQNGGLETMQNCVGLKSILSSCSLTAWMQIISEKSRGF